MFSSATEHILAAAGPFPTGLRIRDFVEAVVENVDWGTQWVGFSDIATKEYWPLDGAQRMVLLRRICSTSREPLT